VITSGTFPQVFGFAPQIVGLPNTVFMLTDSNGVPTISVPQGATAAWILSDNVTLYTAIVAPYADATGVYFGLRAFSEYAEAMGPWYPNPLVGRNVTPTTVPDPGSTLLLLGMGVAGLTAFRRRCG
jgi:hypothetical protein